jgi:hypothetical protein
MDIRLAQDEILSMKLTGNVLLARNVLFGMAVFILFGGIAMLVTDPRKWQDYLLMFGVSAFAFNIVWQVNRKGV